MGANSGSAGGGILCGSDNGVEGTSTLTIETKVLGETLSDEELEALLDEVIDSPSILSKVTRGKTLVSAVEEGEVVLLAHKGSNLLPLLLSGINTSGVVRASMENEDGALRSILESGLQAIEIEALGVFVEVGVCGNVEADILEDLVVVDPGRVGDIDGPAASEELGKEESSQVHGTSARDGLKGSNTLLLDSGGLGAKD